MIRWYAGAMAAVGLGLTALPSIVQAFTGYMSPPRYELRARPGEVLREVVTLGNDDTKPTDFEVMTADWTLDASGSPQFQSDVLAPGSCREWVRIERRRVMMPARGERRFRFEVHVPSDAQPMLCRFALLVSNALPQSVVELPNIRLPVQGRLGLIVYVAVGDVKPELSLLQISASDPATAGSAIVAEVRNSGKAQGRFVGILNGTDAKGQRLEFTVANSVILPGETRRIAISPPEAKGQPMAVERPLRLQGNLEWEGGKIPVDVTVR
jgi:fimbrial chaperone protein